ncbi:unnamed protein product [Moneuplotes crassus]|uniref:CRAL-TRIO domain-containing protein n=1 Tax=Euplotes crassus TaxID=5936 RepID=A0AAD1UHI6_EUPCR|nr:unnamed protein product [Moneuplotes crassus]
MQTDKEKYFTVSLETVSTDTLRSSPKNIDLSIKIRGERLSSSRTKLETSFAVTHNTSFFKTSMEEPLTDVISSSLANISLFCYERVLQNNLQYFSMVRENLISKQQYEKDQQEEKLKLEKIVNSQSNNNTAASAVEVIKLDEEVAHEEAKEAELPQEEIFKYNSEENLDRSLFIRDNVWLKWCVERLDGQEKIDSYHELRARIHDKHGHKEITESVLIRFLHGMEYVVDVAENKILAHLEYMNDNDLWHVDESRIANILPQKIFCIHKEDKLERPLIYTKMAKFFPSKYSFEEIRDYCFWHFENMRKAFKPHVESHLGIYDMKGIGKKNVNIAILKKAIPILEDNLPEVCSKMIVVRPSFLLNMMWRMIKPFIHELTLQKVKFLNEKQMKEELLELVEPENLPECYGGEDTEFEEKFD